MNVHPLRQRKKTTFPGDTGRLLAQTSGPLPYNRYQVCIGHFQVAREPKSVLNTQCASVHWIITKLSGKLGQNLSPKTVP